VNTDDDDIGEWDEPPRPRQCHRCEEYERQVAALNTELRWRVDSHNAAMAEVRRLMVQAELAKYGDTPFRLR
jgi:hypothetical protein